MQDPADYELNTGREHAPEVHPDDGPPRKWIAAVVVLLVAALVGGYFLFRTKVQPPPAAADARGAQEGAEPVTPLGGEPMPGDVPPLEESDAFVRELLRHLSNHPKVAAWLATDGLIRNFTVVVTNISEGRTPSGHLKVLRPATGFSVLSEGGTLRVDPRSYERYNDLAAAVESVNPSGTAEIYATLKPRIEDAHRELGSRSSFDAHLERAIVQLLQTPVPQEPVELRPVGIGYGYADPKLESLTGAQKQLLRMGPRNVQIVKDSLREIARELGIPASRLPPP